MRAARRFANKYEEDDDNDEVKAVERKANFQLLLRQKNLTMKQTTPNGGLRAVSEEPVQSAGSTNEDEYEIRQQSPSNVIRGEKLRTSSGSQGSGILFVGGNRIVLEKGGSDREGSFSHVEQKPSRNETGSGVFDRPTLVSGGDSLGSINLNDPSSSVENIMYPRQRSEAVRSIGSANNSRLSVELSKKTTPSFLTREAKSDAGVIMTRKENSASFVEMEPLSNEGNSKIKKNGVRSSIRLIKRYPSLKTTTRAESQSFSHDESFLSTKLSSKPLNEASSFPTCNAIVAKVFSSREINEASLLENHNYNNLVKVIHQNVMNLYSTSFEIARARSDAKTYSHEDIIVVSPARTGQYPVLLALDSILSEDEENDLERIICNMTKRIQWIESNLNEEDDPGFIYKSGRRVFKTHLNFELFLNKTNNQNQPGPKLIVILRDPSDLRFSWFRHIQAIFKHCKVSFPSPLTQDDFAVVTPSAFQKEPPDLDYESFLTACLKHSKNDQCLFLFYEDLIAKPEFVYEKLAVFMNVDFIANKKMLSNLIKRVSIQVKIGGGGKTIFSPRSSFSSEKQEYIKKTWDEKFRDLSCENYGVLYEKLSDGLAYPFSRGKSLPLYGSPVLSSKSKRFSFRSNVNSVPEQQHASQTATTSPLSSRGKKITTAFQGIVRTFGRRESSSEVVRNSTDSDNNNQQH